MRADDPPFRGSGGMRLTYCRGVIHGSNRASNSAGGKAHLPQVRLVEPILAKVGSTIAAVRRHTWGAIALPSSISLSTCPVAPSTISSWPLAASSSSIPTTTPRAAASRNSQRDRSKTMHGSPDPTVSASTHRRASAPARSSSPRILIWRASAQITGVSGEAFLRVPRPADGDHAPWPPCDR
jgi:hypothetical protein